MRIVDGAFGCYISFSSQLKTNENYNRSFWAVYLVFVTRGDRLREMETRALIPGAGGGVGSRSSVIVLSVRKVDG